MFKRHIYLLPDLNWKIFFKRKKYSSDKLKSDGDFYYTRNAIRLSLPILGLNSGDEILVPTYNSRSEVQALQDYGLQLKHYDTQRNTIIDLAKLEGLVTSKTKALYVIHYFGLAQPISEIKKFCKRHNLIFLEDCALSLFSKDLGQNLGSFGSAGYYCYRKYLEIPNGGSLILKSEQPHVSLSDNLSPALLSTMVELLGLFTKHIFKYHVLSSIYNIIKKLIRYMLRPVKIDSGVSDFDSTKIKWSMSQISEYIIKRLDIESIIQKRTNNYFYLKKKLEPIINSNFDIALLDIKEQPGFVPFCMPLIVDDNITWRDKLQKFGIETGAWWRYDPYFEESDKYPNNKWLRKHLLEVPIHQSLTKVDLDNIYDKVSKIMNSDYENV